MASKKTRFSTMLYVQQSETSDFQRIASLPTFIDKTLLIKHLFESNYYHWIITAPPGYGKSTNLDMIKRFVECPIDKDTGKEYVFSKTKNYKIFQKCKLFYNWELFFHLHSGRYSVIHLSLKDVYGSSMETLRERFAIKLCYTFKRHGYLKGSAIFTENEKQQLFRYSSLKACKKLTATEIECGIVFLAEMLTRFLPNRHVYVLIDDYDHPITKFLQDTSEITHNIDFFRFFDRIFDSILRTEPKNFITRSLFTGVMPINFDSFKSQTASGRLNNHILPYPSTIIDFYSTTQEEVIDLCQRHHYSHNVVAEQGILLYFSFFLNDQKPIINTNCLLRYLTTRQFNHFYHFDKMFNFLTSSLYDHNVRYFTERLLAFEWVVFPKSVPVQIKDLICMREAYLRVGPINGSPLAIFLCLMHYGFFDVDISLPSTLYFRIANPLIKYNVQLAIINYYGKELNEKMAACAETLQKLFLINSSSDSCIDFLMQYREILIIYSRQFTWMESFRIQCIIDILAKCPVHPVKRVILNQDEHYLMFEHTIDLDPSDESNKTKMNVIIIHITFQSIITKTLADIFVTDRLYRNLNNIRNHADIDSLICIGINTDENENFKCSMGLLINDNNLDNANYYFISE